MSDAQDFNECGFEMAFVKFQQDLQALTEARKEKVGRDLFCVSLVHASSEFLLSI